MTKTELLRENERLKRLVRFQFLTLGFYGTPSNYQHGERSNIAEDGGHEAKECDELVEFLGFDKADICNKYSGPWHCSNCGGSLKYKNISPCECDLPEVAGICKKDFRKDNHGE